MTDRELMQKALDALDLHAKQYPHMVKGYTADAASALRERLAQPEQDVPEASCGNMGPVGWLESPDGAFRANPLYKIQFPSSLLSWQVPLYTSPPQRKPLTDKAITQVIDSMPKKMKGFMVDWDLYEFARAIEAAHGIKENT
jgi:hypothetical protein